MSRVVLRLYVAGDGPNSIAARANLRRLLRAYDPSTHVVEVVDCLREPLRALQEGVLVTPTLLRLEPPPVRTIIGSLSDSARVLEALGLGATADAITRDDDSTQGDATATTAKAPARGAP